MLKKKFVEFEKTGNFSANVFFFSFCPRWNTFKEELRESKSEIRKKTDTGKLHKLQNSSHNI